MPQNVPYSPCLIASAYCNNVGNLRFYFLPIFGFKYQPAICLHKLRLRCFQMMILQGIIFYQERDWLSWGHGVWVGRVKWGISLEFLHRQKRTILVCHLVWPKCKALHWEDSCVIDMSNKVVNSSPVDLIVCTWHLQWQQGRRKVESSIWNSTLFSSHCFHFLKLFVGYSLIASRLSVFVLGEQGVCERNR